MSRRYKLAVLGSTGMLGHALGHHFVTKTDHDVSLSLRNIKYSYDPTRHFYFDALDYIDAKTKTSFDGYDYVINCIGGIKQNALNDEQLYRLNVVFPQKLAAACEQAGSRLIHISTDCVFSGEKGQSTELDEPKPVDSYGLSKLTGEPTTCMVIRTSFVGTELHGAVSLLGWAMSQRGKSVTGYTNHLWNGVTTQQFAQCCDDIILNDRYCVGLRHIFNPTPVTKAEMLEAFNRQFGLNLSINHAAAFNKIDRTLSTVHDLCSKLNVPSFEEMISVM